MAPTRLGINAVGIELHQGDCQSHQIAGDRQEVLRHGNDGQNRQGHPAAQKADTAGGSLNGPFTSSI